MSSCGLSYVCLKRDSSDIYSSSSKDMSHVTLESPVTFLKTISPHTVILLGLKPSTYEWRERKTGHSSAHNTSIQVQMVSQASDLGSVLRIFFYWVSLPSTWNQWPSSHWWFIVVYVLDMRKVILLHSFCFLPNGGCPLVKHCWFLYNLFFSPRKERLFFKCSFWE